MYIRSVNKKYKIEDILRTYITYKRRLEDIHNVQKSSLREPKHKKKIFKELEQTLKYVKSVEKM